jgi:serralysin
MPLLKFDGSLAVSTATAINNLYGTAATDTLTGGSGADSLWGGQGDLMTGAAGDDTYYVKALNDRVVELAGGGTDKIVAWQSIYLANYANVENVAVSGDGLYAAGNGVDNIVEGGAGKEQIYGGGGQDILVGGAGADVFIVVKGEGNDVIQDFSAAEDNVRLKAGYTSFAQVQSHLTQVGTDVLLDLGGGDGLMFRNLSVAQLTAANFQLQLDSPSRSSRRRTSSCSSTRRSWAASASTTSSPRRFRSGIRRATQPASGARTSGTRERKGPAATASSATASCRSTPRRISATTPATSPRRPSSPTPTGRSRSGRGRPPTARSSATTTPRAC